MLTAGWRSAVRGAGETLSDLADLVRPLPRLSRATGASEVFSRIHGQQFRHLMQAMPANVTAAGVGALLWLGVMTVFVPGPGVVWWGLGALAGIAGMALLVRRFARAQPPDEALPLWEVRCGRLTVLMGCLWGCVGLVVQGNEILAPYVAVGLLLVMAGSLGLYATYRPGISWLVSPCALLMTVYLVRCGGLLNLALALGSLVTVVLLIRLARAQNALTTQALLEAEERRALAAALEVERAAAEAANQAKTRFLAMVGHDLRQPMHSIALLSGVLRHRPTGDHTRLGAQLGASVQAMDDLISALLEVARLDDGTLPLQVGPLPLTPLLDCTALQFAAQAHAKGLAFRVRASALCVLSDAYQLRRVLANLVSNAIRHTPKGGVLVRCRVRGSTAWLQVWDSGVGIAPADRHRIFDEFVQLEAAPLRQGIHGVGLGLAIVRKVAQRLGHPVVLRSRVGRGSMFAIGVPLDPSVEPCGSLAGREGSLAGLLDGRLILLIDNDEAVLRSMRTLLEAFPCRVLAATSLPQALAVLEDDGVHAPDMVISDYRLGEGATGLDAIQAIRARAGHAVPALVVTAETAAARAAAPTGDIGVAAKPLQVHTLAAALGAAWRRAGGPDREPPDAAII